VGNTIQLVSSSFLLLGLAAAILFSVGKKKQKA